MTDSLGDRMKENYEDRTRFSLMRRAYTFIRIDGKAFHTYTKGCKRPFDDDLITDMDETAKYLCENVQGAKLAYIQSDEISILMTDFDKLTSDAWFDNNLQKIASISASLATAKFNQLRMLRILNNNSKVVFETIPLAHFDSRVFQVPTRTESENHLIWRQQDATRNSISMAAQSVYSHKALEGKSGSDKQEMLFQKGVNWNDYPIKYKRGRVVRKQIFLNDQPVDALPDPLDPEAKVRNKWIVDENIPIFTQEIEYLNKLIPLNV